MNRWTASLFVALAAPVIVFVVTPAVARELTPQEEMFRDVSIDDLRDVRRLLQDRVVDPKTTDEHGDTILIAAIRSDANRVVDYLVADPSTNIEATDAVDETALMIAAYRKRRDVVEKLLARGAVVDRPGWTALHYAAAVDAGDIVTLLLQHAAPIDAGSPNRTTPLMMAARGGFDALCRTLVAAGADPTLVNDRDLTASDFARRDGDANLADWLAAQAAQRRAKYGSSPGADVAPRD